jgi:hypothetical protein
LGRVISHEGELDLAKYVDLDGRSIDGMKCLSAGGKEWLLVTLNDGVLLVFNYYGASLDNFKDFGLPVDNIIKLARMLKVGDII